MVGYGSTILILAWLWAAGTVWAGAQEISALRTEYKQLAGRQDLLEQQRRKVVLDAGQLSARIDSLKEGDSDPGALQEALRSSLVLVQRIVDIDRQIEELKVRQDSVKIGLRLAYDWEIGMLIQKISQQPDRGLLGQLMIYQEEREALGNEPVGSGLQYSEEMALSPDDGPDEIRQKMELMEDIAARLRTEGRRTAEQLRRLEEEQRLRTRVRVFASEISLFDEHLPEGRVLVRAGGLAVAAGGGGSRVEEVQGDQGKFEGALAGPAVEGGLENAEGALAGAAVGGGLENAEGALAGAAVGGGLENAAVEPSPGERGMETGLRAGREMAREGELLAIGRSGGDDITLEIRKLKAHQQEIGQLEAVVRERAETFKQFLDKMLEGEE